MDFWTSDTHFNHARIIELSQRPFKDLPEMHEEIIRRWNAKVTSQDTVFHLGDLALGAIDDLNPIIERLNGQIILIRGNHDKSPKNLKIKVPSLKLIFNSLNMSAEHGKSGYKVFMRHFPPGDPTTWPAKHHATVFLCGHVHGAWSRRTSKNAEGQTFETINVGADVRDFTPQTFSELMATPARPEQPRTDQCKVCGMSLVTRAPDGSTETYRKCSKHPEPEM